MIVTVIVLLGFNIRSGIRHVRMMERCPNCNSEHKMFETGIRRCDTCDPYRKLAFILHNVEEELVCRNCGKTVWRQVGFGGADYVGGAH